MQTVVAFLTAIGLLVAVHEWGHFVVARLCGVKVIRFSIGFGPVLWRVKSQRTGTEFALSAVPLGGYVKMLDGREGPVHGNDKQFAFDSQSLFRRSAIVIAGPFANLLLAVSLYAVVNWQVVPQPAPLLPVPFSDSLAAKAGWHGGERVSAVGLSSDDLQPVRTFEDVRWWLTKAGLERQPIFFRLVGSSATAEQNSVRELDLTELDGSAADASLFQKIGWISPFSKPVMGDVTPQGRADQAGLKLGDVVLLVDGVAVVDASQLRGLIRLAPERLMQWRVMRNAEVLSLTVTPKMDTYDGAQVGRVGAYIGASPEMVDIQYGFAEGLVRSVQKTWEVSRISLVAFGQMLTGQMSLRSLNGPLAIADFAGKSAAMGPIAFINFLALISISLGVLNLLPLPVLDGGHLMYYLWEGVAGHPVPERWWEMLQRGGIALLLVMMSIAFYNDVLHIWG